MWLLQSSTNAIPIDAGLLLLFLLFFTNTTISLLSSSSMMLLCYKKSNKRTVTAKARHRRNAANQGRRHAKSQHKSPAKQPKEPPGVPQESPGAEDPGNGANPEDGDSDLPMPMQYELDEKAKRIRDEGLTKNPTDATQYPTIDEIFSKEKVVVRK